MKIFIHSMQTILKLSKAGPGLKPEDLWRWWDQTDWGTECQSGYYQRMANYRCCIITIGRNSGEGSDRVNAKGDFQPDDSEQQLIKNVSAAFKSRREKLFVTLRKWCCLISKLERFCLTPYSSCLAGGQETGNSIAGYISGKVNPSGKIADYFFL